MIYGFTNALLPCRSGLNWVLVKACLVVAIGVFCRGEALSDTIALTGSNGDGYFAMVGINQEGNATTANVISDPTSAKFFDYPKYVNPDNTSNIYIMSVEPYKFGLVYPTPLHPTGPNVFADVSATFAEAFTEDADFGNFDIGSIEWDETQLTGVGTEMINTASITLLLDGSDFDSKNRQDFNGVAGDPSGRSNNNEFASSVSLTATGLSGTGLTFNNGMLTSIDFVANVDVSSLPTAAPISAFAFDASGTLTFSGMDFAFDVDGQDSTPFASDVRVLLNRSGTINAVPEPSTLGLCGGVALLMGLRRKRRNV